MKQMNKKIISLFLVLTLVLGTFAVGNIADAVDRATKVERCTVKAAIISVDGVQYRLEGGLKPFVVPMDTDWKTFFSQMEIIDFESTKNDACTSWNHDCFSGHIIFEGEEKEFLFTMVDTIYSNHSWWMEDKEFAQDYYDMKFQYRYGVTDETPTALNVRIEKGYQITYDLQGGAFNTETLDGYVSRLEYTLPTPEKEGYDFIGWTGEGLDTPTVNVVLPEGTTGDKNYVANWEEQPVPEPIYPEPQLPTVGTKLKDTGNKANYKITVSKENAMEVEYVAPVKKNSKKVTIPETVTLSNGTKAKVTSIAANAFKGNKKLTTVVIGKNIKKIGKKAFYNCKNLKKITINSTSLTKKTIGAKAFKNTSNKAVVKVVKKKLKSYKKILVAKGISKKAKIKAK